MENVSLGGAGTMNIGDVARDLNEICRTATIDLAYRVGQFVIQHLFQADAAMWEREGPKNHSYRSLAARGDLVLSPSALCRAVSIYTLVERLGGRERWRHLAASHFQEVLPIEPQAQRAMLILAEEQEWSVSRLRSEVAQRREGRTSKRARVATRSLNGLAHRLSRHVRALEEADLELDGKSAADLKEAFDRLSREVDAIAAEIDRRTGAGGRTIETRESDVVELKPKKHSAGAA